MWEVPSLQSGASCTWRQVSCRQRGQNTHLMDNLEGVTQARTGLPAPSTRWRSLPSPSVAPWTGPRMTLLGMAMTPQDLLTHLPIPILV